MEYLIANLPLLIATLSSIIALVALGLTLDLRRRWQRVFGARNGRRDALGEMLERLKGAESHLDALEPRMEALERIGTIAVQKFGFLRFNPFGDTGSDQSFAVCLLDRENNGFVLSSLYTRGGVRIYAKEIKAGSAKHPLSEEEKKVLAQAINTENHKS